MVHVPGPIYPPTKHLEETLERLLGDQPESSIAEIERLVPDCRNFPRRALEELIARIKQRGGASVRASAPGRMTAGRA